MDADGRPEQDGSPRLRRLVDWRHAARLIARGVRIADVAREVGCSRTHLSRRRNHDAVFRAWIEESSTREAAHVGAEGEPLHELRQAVNEAIRREVKGGNVRVILWLADRLKLLEPPGEQTPDGALGEMLRGLGPAELREFAALRDDAGGSGDDGGRGEEGGT